MTEFRRLMVRQLEKELYFLNYYPRQGKKKDTVTREAAQHMVRALACVGLGAKSTGMTNRKFDKLFQKLLILINSGAHLEKGHRVDVCDDLSFFVDDIEKEVNGRPPPPPPPMPIQPPPLRGVVVDNQEVKPSATETKVQPLAATTASRSPSSTDGRSGNASPGRSSAFMLRGRSRTSSLSP